ncbi:MAG: response regulator receiver protein [Chitinophagaceae bacterium]|nr:response regulator receiver protein [Chitinophagaceae bacterium]
MDKLITILLVEDDQLDAMDIRRTLDKTNIFYKLYIAKNGEEALELLSNNTVVPDVALVDVSMPKMNGLEFLSSIRQDERWRHLKCFIITTSDEKTDKDAAAALGISGYILKPLKLKNSPTQDAFNLMIDLMNISAAVQK